MSTSAAGRDGPRFGFAAQVEHTGIRRTAGTAVSQGLEDGIALFLAAEDLGYDVGYVRGRHLQDALASPLLFLAALGPPPGARLGTALLPLRFENAGRLAEDLASRPICSPAAAARGELRLFLS